ncbi:MAG: diguanylate cyclase [Nostoc sp.]
MMLAIAGYATVAANIVCRYGGEKFVLVLPEMTQKKAFQHAEQIHLSFQTARLGSGGKQNTYNGFGWSGHVSRSWKNH